jgi:hypothetical protein
VVANGTETGAVGHRVRERPDNAIAGDSVSDGLRAPPRTHSHNRCSEPLSVLAPHEGDGNNDGSGSRNRRCLGDLQPAILRFPAQKVWGPPRKTGIGDSAIKGAWRLPEEGPVNNGKADAYRYGELDQTAATDMSEKVLRWFAQIGAAVIKPTKNFLRTRSTASDGERAESALEETRALAAVTENAVANLTTTKSFSVRVTAGAQIDSAAPTVLDQEEIQRRRDLVRTLFNDFWSGAYEKPAAFVERLDQAEDYLNERLKANGEVWRLDATTRAMLGLPPRSSSPD